MGRFSMKLTGFSLRCWRLPYPSHTLITPAPSNYSGRQLCNRLLLFCLQCFLWLAACTPGTHSTTALPTLIAPQPTPAHVIGGGTLKNGPFTFDLRLFREADLNQQPVASSLYSDMNGIGEYMVWTYQGDDPIGPVETYWGTLPHLDQLHQETFSSISRGSRAGRTGGILLPGGFFLPGKSNPGDHVQLALKVHTPNGEFGAVLHFTLSQGVNGFEPSDISVTTLLSKANNATP